MPAAVGPLAGVADGRNTNGQNAATVLFSGGSVGADAIPNATLVAAVPSYSRLAAIFNTAFASQADLDNALAALGFIAFAVGGTGFGLIPSVNPNPAITGKPEGVITTTAATGSIRMALSASISA